MAADRLFLIKNKDRNIAKRIVFRNLVFKVISFKFNKKIISTKNVKINTALVPSLRFGMTVHLRYYNGNADLAD